MVFIARYWFPGKFNPSSKRILIPGKVLLHSSGYREAEEKMGKEKALIEPEKHALNVFLERQKMFRELGIIFFRGATYWNNEGNKILELVGYSDIMKWPGNPDGRRWVIKEGRITKPAQDLWKPNTDICGETEIFLGREEEFRRQTADLEAYIFGKPDLDLLEPREPKYRRIELLA